MYYRVPNSRFLGVFSFPKLDIVPGEDERRAKARALENFTAKYVQGERIYPPAEWETSNTYSGQCPKCKTRASYSKHNCRICGLFHCEDCAEKMDIELPAAFNKKNKSGPQRVCDECRYRILGGGVLCDHEPAMASAPSTPKITPLSPEDEQAAMKLKSPFLSPLDIKEALSRMKGSTSATPIHTDHQDSTRPGLTLKIKLRKTTDDKPVTSFTVPLFTSEPLPSPLEPQRLQLASSGGKGSFTRKPQLSVGVTEDALQTIPLSEEDCGTFHTISNGVEQKITPPDNPASDAKSEQNGTEYREMTLADVHRNFVLKKLPKILVDLHELRMRQHCETSSQKAQQETKLEVTNGSSDCEDEGFAPLPSPRIDECERRALIEKMYKRCDDFICYYDTLGKIIDRDNWTRVTIKELCSACPQLVFGGPFETDDADYCGGELAVFASSFDFDHDLEASPLPSPPSCRSSPLRLKPVAMLPTAPKVPSVNPLSPSFQTVHSPSLLSPRGTGPRSTHFVWPNVPTTAGPITAVTVDPVSATGSPQSPSVRSLPSLPATVPPAPTQPLPQPPKSLNRVIPVTGGHLAQRRGAILHTSTTSTSRMANQVTTTRSELNDISSDENDNENENRRTMGQSQQPLTNQELADKILSQAKVTSVTLKLSHLHLASQLQKQGAGPTLKQTPELCALEMTPLTPRSKLQADAAAQGNNK